jgi:sulfite dehydrogenase (cytochrome) subunit B
MNRSSIVIALLGFGLCGLSAADEKAIALKDAPERPVFIARCTACHSADYVLMQSSFADGKFWSAEVKKMRDVYKAPMDDADQAAVLNYLQTLYVK